MQGLQRCPVIGLFPNHRIKGFEQKPGNSFAGGGFHPKNPKKFLRLKNFQIFLEGVIGLEQDPVIQMFIDPIEYEVKVSEVDYETILVQFLGFEGEGDCPTVPMQGEHLPA